MHTHFIKPLAMICFLLLFCPPLRTKLFRSLYFCFNQRQSHCSSLMHKMSQCFFPNTILKGVSLYCLWLTFSFSTNCLLNSLPSEVIHINNLFYVAKLIILFLNSLDEMFRVLVVVSFLATCAFLLNIFYYYNELL